MYCKYCSTNKPDKDFETFNYKGKRYTRKKCKRCKQDTQNMRVEANRKWLKSYKMTLICTLCGNSDERVLEFHHREDKDFNVSEMLTHSKSRIMAEIKKCDPVCANCHRIIHSN